MAVVDLGILITAVNRTAGMFGKVQRDLNKVDKNAKKAGRSLRAIDLVLSAIAVGSGISFAKSIVKTADALERGRIRMALFAGSFEEGAKQFAQLREQFKFVPIDTQTMLNGFSRLKAAGLDPLSGSLLTIVDAVSAFGGGTDEINRTIIAIQQIAGKGVLSMEELRQQLGETVPFALAIMARETNRTIPEFISAVENGMVSAQEAIDAFLKGAEESFGGFSEIMANTISGGTSRVRKEFENLVDRVFGEGLLDTRIGIFLNNVADGIARVAENITQSDIDAFTRFLENIVIVGGGVIQAISRIAKGIAFLVDAIFKAMGSFGADVTTSGLIGFMLFGRIGLGAGLIFATIARLGSELTVFTDGARQLLNNILGDAVKFGLIGFLLFGRKGLIAGAMLSFLANIFLEIADSVKLGVALIRSSIPEAFGGISIDELERLVKLKRDLSAKGQTISGQGFADLFGLADPRNTGQAGGAAGQGLGTSADNFFAGLLGSKEQAIAIRKEQERMLSEMAKLNAEIQDATAGEKARKAELQAQRKNLEIQIALQRTRNEMARTANRLAEARRSIQIDFFSSQATDQARKNIQGLASEIGNIEVKILSLQKKMIGADKDQQNAIKNQIVGLIGLQIELQKVSDATTATGLLSKELWESVGATISDTAKAALSGLAQGTLDLEQIQLRVWASLTDAAANYLVELAKIALKQAAIGAFGGGTSPGPGGGGGAFGGLGALIGGFFANGGVFSGGTSLGQGIVRGPTLFAAGEGGKDEAVVPLANVGGQIGVRSAGGGGSLALHIHAIDSKSGTQFLMAHADDLVNIAKRTRSMTSE